jgi:hypothetical protein
MLGSINLGQSKNSSFQNDKSLSKRYNPNDSQNCDPPQILRASIDSFSMGIRTRSKPTLGIKWNKDTSSTKNRKILSPPSPSQPQTHPKKDCKGVQKRIMSLVSFTQEDYLNTLERIKCEENIRKGEKSDMVEIVQALLNIMSRRLENFEDDKENCDGGNGMVGGGNEVGIEEEGLREIKGFIEGLRKAKRNQKLVDENDKLLRRLAGLKKKIDGKLDSAKGLADVIIKKRENVF